MTAEQFLKCIENVDDTFFNCAQPFPSGKAFRDVQAAEDLLKGLVFKGLKIKEVDYWEASYHHLSDLIMIGTKTSFPSEAIYYGVFFHELAHAALRRLGKPKPDFPVLELFYPASYCAEEIIAETAAFALCNSLQIDILEKASVYCKFAFDMHPEAIDLSNCVEEGFATAAFMLRRSGLEANKR